MKVTIIATVALSALLGFIHSFARVYFWSHLAIVDPMPRWLAMHVQGYWWWAILLGRDLVINLILCMPLAFALWLLRPFHPWIYLATAMLAGEVWDDRLAFVGHIHQGLGYGIYVPGLIMTMLAFAGSGAATWMLVRKRIKFASDPERTL